MRKYNFISGLPRSGSTLLSSILKQNPRFTTGISDPLQMYAHSIITDTSLAAGMESTVNIDKRRQLIRGLFDNFYNDGNEVCFNTNRGWAADTALLADLFPNFKMIICLREIPWILDSFEVLNDKNPYTLKPLYHHQSLSSVQERCNMLMGGNPNFAGYVAGPLMNVQQSMFCNQRNQLLFLEYDTLVSDPYNSLQQIYEFLEEPWFEHDFNNVEDSYDEFDEQAKITGLHTIRKKVEYKERRTILPTEIWQNYTNSSFWVNNHIKKELNWVKTGSNKKINTIPNKIFNKQL